MASFTTTLTVVLPFTIGISIPPEEVINSEVFLPVYSAS